MDSERRSVARTVSAVCKICAEERDLSEQEQKDKVYLGESSRSNPYRSKRDFEDYHHFLHYSTVQYSTVQYSTVQ